MGNCCPGHKYSRVSNGNGKQERHDDTQTRDKDDVSVSRTKRSAKRGSASPGQKQDERQRARSSIYASVPTHDTDDGSETGPGIELVDKQQTQGSKSDKQESKAVSAPLAHQALAILVAMVVPHAKPPSGPATSRHLYDTTASKAEQYLVEAITKARYSHTFQASEWIGDMNREQCDLNRIQGRSCSLKRHEFTVWLEQKRQEHRRVYVLDIHSFPEKEGVWGTSSEQDDAYTSDLVILDNCPERGKFFASSYSLLDFLTERKFDVTLLKGAATVNDINREALEQGAERIFLLEFNEMLPDDKLENLCQTLVEWLSLEALDRHPDRLVSGRVSR